MKMKAALYVLGFVALSACAPKPVVVPMICDREAQEWNKFDTAEDACASAPIVSPFPKPRPEIDRPNDPRNPDNEPPVSDPDPDTDTPVDDGPVGVKVKGNNGWGNGDQRAPGNSLIHNNAENKDHSHRNNGKGNPN